MAHLAGRVGPDAGGTAMPHEHFLDVAGGDTGALQGGPGGHGTELGGVDVLEGAAKLANGGPGCAQNHDLNGH